MLLTQRNRFLLAWLLLGALAAAVCSLIWPAAHVGSEVIPVSNDSFYHARRILDTANDPSAFYEFDEHIHAPEGSLLVWPWGYDYVMGWIVRIGSAAGLAAEPIRILVWIPVAAVFFSVGLIMLIARRLGLSLWTCCLAATCIALSPLTQYLHGVGFVDHHFAEYIFVLASIAAGLKWLADLSNERMAALAGIVLGLAPAVHNAMFILQLPLLMALLVLWLQHIRAPRRATLHFAAALLTATVAVLIPSVPFRQGMFEYYLLSWFHLYVATGTVVCCCLFSFREFNRRNSIALGSFAVLALVPLIYQIGMASKFLSGNLIRLNAIGEMQSIPQLVYLYGLQDLANRYSLFVFLVPITWGLCVFKVWQQRRNGQVFFWICAACSLPMLVTQFRLHYFGSFALYLPWLVLLDGLADRLKAAQSKVMLATTMLVLLAYAPPMRNQLLGPMPAANDAYFLNVRPMLLALAKACEEDPGIVLADHDIGHHIRYFTKCSVIANNFLLTEQQGAKIIEMEHLFQTPATDLAAAAPLVKYVLVRPSFVENTDRGLTYVSYGTSTSTLVVDLLLQPTAKPPVPPPSQFQLLHESHLIENKTVFPYARLYKIQRSTAVPALVSSRTETSVKLTDAARH
jgi:hypothetical protein